MNWNEVFHEHDSQIDGKPSLHPKPTRAASVDLHRVVRELAETFERRAHEWENAGEHKKPIEGGEAFAEIYREMANDIRAVMGKLPNS